jgi:hypothetical protein
VGVDGLQKLHFQVFDFADQCWIRSEVGGLCDEVAKHNLCDIFKYLVFTLLFPWWLICCRPIQGTKSWSQEDPQVDCFGTISPMKCLSAGGMLSAWVKQSWEHTSMPIFQCTQVIQLSLRLPCWGLMGWQEHVSDCKLIKTSLQPLPETTSRRWIHYTLLVFLLKRNSRARCPTSPGGALVPFPPRGCPAFPPIFKHLLVIIWYQLHQGAI